MNMNLLISIDEVNKTAPLSSFADKLSYGGTMLLIGMLTVFAVLTLIMLSLYAFKFFFHDLAQKKKATPKVVQVVEAAPVTVSKSNDEEIVAAIAAAIAMAESESDGIKFRVVSFKRR